MSESAKTLGQILVDIEANYGGCLWDFMSDSARQLVERTAKEFAKHIRSESASEIERLREALKSAIQVANEAAEEWDKAPSGMRAGKILLALAGHRRGYRADTDAIHAALSTPKESLPVEEGK